MAVSEVLRGAGAFLPDQGHVTGRMVVLVDFSTDL